MTERSICSIFGTDFKFVHCYGFELPYVLIVDLVDSCTIFSQLGSLLNSKNRLKPLLKKILLTFGFHLILALNAHGVLDIFIVIVLM